MNKKGKIFFITSHGTAGDYLFDWLSILLKNHKDIYISMGESIRNKYLKERSRKERPKPELIKDFLIDMCSDNFLLAGECYSYRNYQIPYNNKKFIQNVKIANLIRDPYIWLFHYTKWRINNMNMIKDNKYSINHEWSITKHEYFNKLKLRKYKKNEINVWAFYQGLLILNRMETDYKDLCKNFKIETLYKSFSEFKLFLKHISNSKININRNYYNYLMNISKPKRKNQSILLNGEEEFKKWKSWQHEAYDKILSKKMKNLFSTNYKIY